MRFTNSWKMLLLGLIINCLDICRNPSRHIFHYDARDYFPSMMPEITSQEWSTHTGCPIKRLPVLACYHCKLLASFYWDALSSKIQDWIQSSIQLQHLSGTVFWLSSTHHFVSLEIVEENYACWNDIKSLNNSDNLQ